MLSRLLHLPRQAVRLGRRRYCNAHGCKVQASGRCGWCGRRALFVAHTRRPIEVAGPLDGARGTPCPICRTPARAWDRNDGGPGALVELTPCGHVLVELDPDADRCPAQDPSRSPAPRCVLAAGHYGRKRPHEIVV